MSMYTGLEAYALEGIRKGLDEEQVEELVVSLPPSQILDLLETRQLTGHSMGAALSYYLAVELLTNNRILPPGMRIKVITFGSPRIGDQAFSSFWRKLLEEYRSSNGQESFQEYNIRAYNDGEHQISVRQPSGYHFFPGVPMLPPVKAGYIHHTTNPLFLRNDRLFRIPDSEREYGSFDIPTLEDAPPPLHPNGGHNYYNGRELEKLARRVWVLHELMGGEDDSWVGSYVDEVTRVEKYSLTSPSDSE